jgi:hypothetical protein
MLLEQEAIHMQTMKLNQYFSACAKGNKIDHRHKWNDFRETTKTLRGKYRSKSS